MKICVAGQGAFGIKHIEAIQKIAGIEIATLAGGSADSTREVAQKYGILDAMYLPGAEAPVGNACKAMIRQRAATFRGCSGVRLRQVRARYGNRSSAISRTISVALPSPRS